MSSHHYQASRLAEAAADRPDHPYAIALSRGTLELGYYSPEEVDRQSPHDQDEVYIVVSGEGRFQNGEQVVEFRPGDALFVPAGVEHRFIDFSDDTETWVIFYGPSGGDSA